jgi:hypothetical protein
MWDLQNNIASGDAVRLIYSLVRVSLKCRDEISVQLRTNSLQNVLARTEALLRS